MATYLFTPPYVEEKREGETHRLFMYLVRLRKGISIGKLNGVYIQNRYPHQDDIDTYTEFYAGGHKYSVSETTRTALIAASVGVDATNFTVE